MTILDIAELAGVSASTVSKVMNGKDKDISEKTKRKVLKVIEDKQYIPYSKFREKEGLKNHLIGLVIGKDHKEREGILKGAEKAARQAGYNLVVSYAETLEEIAACVDEMGRKQILGALLVSDKAVDCGKMEKQIVYLSQTKGFEGHQKVTFYYRLSDAGKAAAKCLIEAGHRKIACIIEKGGQAILEGYKQAMREQNLTIRPEWIYEGKSLEEIEQYGILQCLSGKTTAVICGSKEIACCVWKLMERTRTVIPDALSMIAIGDDSILELLGYGITAVKLPSEMMGRDAAGFLIDMIQEDKQNELMRKYPPVIIERNSIVPPAQEKQGERMIVVGSMNMDVIIEVSRIPRNGETQLAERILIFPGGKGGNQAVGAGKLGGQVYMIGCLGNDLDGKQLYASLIKNHVHMDGVIFDAALPSGKAYINVDRNGESTIVVYQGANRNLDIPQINRCRYLFKNAGYCLLSMEIPTEIAEYTIKECKRNYTKIILKPSGAEQMKEELLAEITYFVPNENELNLFVSGNESIEKKSEKLLGLGIENVIVTLGGRGCYLKNKETSMYFAGTGFEAVDTTGGADSFISALAVYLSEGRCLKQAIGFAIYASGITVTRYGVQPALPDRTAVDVYEEEILSKYNITVGGEAR